MATYPRVSPVNLATYAAVIDDPTDSEAANKLAQVDLQTRRFIYDYLSTLVDTTTEMVKPGVIADATLAGKVKGSTSNAGTQQGIVQGTVSTPDLRADAVTTVKILDSNVTTAKIADLNVTTAKINDLAVTTAKIAAANVTAAKLAPDSVETAKILDLNVTTGKINDLAVTAGKIAANVIGGDQLVAGTAEGQVLITGVSPYEFAVKSISGDVTLDKDGVVALVSSGMCEVEEQASKGTSAGASAATTWNVRGVTAAWTKTFDTLASSFLTINTEKLTLTAGTYIIEAEAPAYKSAGHQIRINRYNSGNATQERAYGSAALATVASADMTSSFVRCKMTFATGDYFKVEHYTTAAEAADGLGLAVNATPSGVETVLEVYAQVKIQRIS